jgi:hypothetical protein
MAKMVAMMVACFGLGLVFMTAPGVSMILKLTGPVEEFAPLDPEPAMR